MSVHLFLTRTVVGFRPTLTQYDLNLITSAKILFPNKATSLGLGGHEFLGNTIQISTETDQLLGPGLLPAYPEVVCPKSHILTVSGD